VNETISPAVFREAYRERNRPERIVTLGAYLPTAQSLAVHGKLRYVREARATYGAKTPDVPDVSVDAARLEHTRLVEGLNRGRKWARERFLRWLDPLLEDDIAVAIVPSHDPFTVDTPLRALAQVIVEAQAGRTDATGVLVRHTAIRRIVFGGDSTMELHRETVRVESARIVAGRAVLLLDDVVKSGNSLRACRALLEEHGASVVQAVALGRLVSG